MCNLIAPGELHTGFSTSEYGWTYRNLHIEARLLMKLLDGLDWQKSMDIRFRSPVVMRDFGPYIVGSGTLLQSVYPVSTLGTSAVLPSLPGK
jgi:hypothetical protein